MTEFRTSLLIVFTLIAALSSGAATTLAQSSAGGQQHDAHQAGTSAQPGHGSPGATSMMGQQAGHTHGMMMDRGEMGRMMAMMHGRGMMAGGMPFEHVEGRLAFLKTELKITPEQEPQWNAFADAFRSVASSARGAMQQMMGGDRSVTAMQRLENYERMLMFRLDAVRAIRASFDPLYATLSDDQKKMADDLVSNPMGLM